jgi:hypothetical protein
MRKLRTVALRLYNQNVTSLSTTHTFGSTVILVNLVQHQRFRLLANAGNYS